MSSETSNGMHVPHGLLEGLYVTRFSEETLQHRRIDIAGTHGVDPDAFGPVITSHRAGQGMYRAFSGAVDRKERGSAIKPS